MKKLIILMIFIFGISFQTPVFATTANIKPIVKQTTTERLIDKYSDKIIDQLTVVVNKLKGPSKAIFHSLVLVELTEGLTGPVLLLFGILFWMLYTKEYKRINTILAMDDPPSSYNNRYGAFDDSNSSIQLWFYVIAGIVLIFFGVLTSACSIDHLIAPQWFAVKELFHLFK